MDNPKYIQVMRQVASDFDGISHELFQVASDLERMDQYSRNRQQPVRVNDQGVALVSGCNARIFSLLKSGILSPYAVMMDVLGSERYAAIVA